MAIGDLIFVRSKTFMGRAIELIDGGSLHSFSHCCVSLCEDNSHILESQGMVRSRIVPFYFDDYEILPLYLTDGQKQLALKVAIELTGIPYDYLDIAEIALDKIFLTHLHKMWHSKSEMICSELCIDFINKVGLANLDTGLTPNELYKALKERELG